MNIPNDIEEIARDLMDSYHLTDWTLKINRAKTIGGICDHEAKTIYISKNLELHPVPFIENIVLHEIAHAMVGPGHGHSNFWREIAISIGCDGEEFCESFVPASKCITCQCGKTYVLRHTYRANKYVCKQCNTSLCIVKKIPVKKIDERH
jgi:predicted SprT family Zn-dependent metalloprotease